MKIKLTDVELWATVDEPNVVVVEIKAGAALFSFSLPADTAAELGLTLRDAARRARKPVGRLARSRAELALKRAHG